RRRAAARFAGAENDVTYAGGVLTCGSGRVTLAELAAERRLAAGASFEVKKLTYAGCAAAVVLDVDRETGAVHLRGVVVGADVGRAVNPALVDAQLVGGVAFGIGNTLHETLEYDALGQLVSGTFMDYALPYAPDVPPVDSFYQEVRATTNPLRRRGLAACGNPALADSEPPSRMGCAMRLARATLRPARCPRAPSASSRCCADARRKIEGPTLAGRPLTSDARRGHRLAFGSRDFLNARLGRWRLD